MYMYTHIYEALLIVFTTEPWLQVLLIVYTDPISWPGEKKYYSIGKVSQGIYVICMAFAEVG